MPGELCLWRRAWRLLRRETRLWVLHRPGPGGL